MESRAIRREGWRYIGIGMVWGREAIIMTIKESYGEKEDQKCKKRRGSRGRLTKILLAREPGGVKIGKGGKDLEERSRWAKKINGRATGQSRFR